MLIRVPNNLGLDPFPVPVGHFVAPWGGIVSQIDNNIVMGDNNVVMKPRCYRKPQCGIVSRSSCYVATRPVIGQNMYRGYTNHSFVVKI